MDYSDEGRAHVSPLSVRNEVTDFVSCKRDRAIGEISHVLFFREVAEGIFVLSNHERNTRDIGISDDLEIKRGLHIQNKERT